LGDLVEINQEEFIPLPPLTTVLKYGRKSGFREIPVELEVYLSEIGILETYCRSLESPHRWRLQFALREMELKRPETPEGVLVKPEDEKKPLPIEEEKIKETLSFLKEVFDQGQGLSQVTNQLEKIFEMERHRWPLPLLRVLADELIALKGVRKRTALHEARWLNLAGFTMRPGYGDQADPFRIRKLWSLYFEGPQHRSDKAVSLEWWIFWRRVAGGLNAGQQEQLFARLKPHFLPAKGQKVSRVSPTERREMWLCVANLERLSAKTKLLLAERLLSELEKKLDRSGLFVFSRLLARDPLYGPANAVVPANQAAPLVKKFLRLLERRKLKGSLHRASLEALLRIARLTGDRVRDFEEEVLKEDQNPLGKVSFSILCNS
jgi:hypothetical protein